MPKHGYRFIAPVEPLDGQFAAPAAENDQWRDFISLGSTGTIGGALGSAIGGLIYGFAASSQSTVGSLSVLLVLLCVTLLVAVVGAAGVSFAIATSAFAQAQPWLWLTIAGAGGGLVVGAFGKMLGHDVFSLLVGQAPSRSRAPWRACSSASPSVWGRGSPSEGRHAAPPRSVP